jgi:hypothetical protein
MQFTSQWDLVLADEVSYAIAAASLVRRFLETHASPPARSPPPFR